jgi:hypothetical protein
VANGHIERDGHAHVRPVRPLRMGNSWASSRAAAGIVQMGNIDRLLER